MARPDTDRIAAAGQPGDRDAHHRPAADDASPARASPLAATTGRRVGGHLRRVPAGSSPIATWCAVRTPSWSCSRTVASSRARSTASTPSPTSPSCVSTRPGLPAAGIGRLVIAPTRRSCRSPSAAPRTPTRPRVTSGVVSALGRDVVVDEPAVASGERSATSSRRTPMRSTRQLGRRARERHRDGRRHQHGRRRRSSGRRLRHPHQHRQADHGAGDRGSPSPGPDGHHVHRAQRGRGTGAWTCPSTMARWLRASADGSCPRWSRAAPPTLAGIRKATHHGHRRPAHRLRAPARRHPRPVPAGVAGPDRVSVLRGGTLLELTL